MTAHTLGDVSRFTKMSKQVASFAGLDQIERPSAGNTHFGGISKARSSLLRFQLGLAANVGARLAAKLKGIRNRLSKKKPKALVKTDAARLPLVKLSIMLRDKISTEGFDRRGTSW